MQLDQDKNITYKNHRDKTRVCVFQCFDFISFPHLNMQIMGPNKTKN